MTETEAFNENEHPHMRYNPLKDDWVLISPHRTLRPWSGQMETAPDDSHIPDFDPTNPLCPGVKRSSGQVTPHYKSTYVFANDFPAMLEAGPSIQQLDDPLFKLRDVKGACRVMCFSPKSNVHLGTMNLNEIVDVIGEWMKQMNELGGKYKWVQIFENRGAMMGCSNPHPHCQIWASNFMPNEPRIKDCNLRNYYEKYERPMLMDYLHRELAMQTRIVYQNDGWVVLVPYWAVWPFETLLLPKTQIERFTDLNTQQQESLADAMNVLVAKYDNLFECSFPYTMGWHCAPTGDLLTHKQPHWTVHASYLPPLLRSATVKKFIVGYELLAQSQRDLTAEKAAGMLRNQSHIHYKKKLPIS